MEAFQKYVYNIMCNPMYKKDRPFLNQIWNLFKEFYAKDPEHPRWRNIAPNDSESSEYEAYFE